MYFPESLCNFFLQTTEISRRRYSNYANSMTKPLTRVDFLLKRFSHSKALSVALSFRPKSRHPDPQKVQAHLHLAVAVIRELIRRDMLKTAVAGRNIKQIGHLFRFIRRHIWRHEVTPSCLELYNCILSEFEYGVCI